MAVVYGVGANAENTKHISVIEDATPLDVEKFTGGVGQANISINEERDTRLLLEENVSVTYPGLGDWHGVVRAATGVDGDVNLTGDSMLSLLNSDHTVAPMNTTLRNVLLAYLGKVGLPNVLYPVDIPNDIGNRAVVIPGWSGNVWDNLKQLCAVQKIEVALVGNRIVFRHLRTTTHNLDRTVTQSWDVNSQNTARQIQIYYYNHKYTTRGEVYPVIGDEPSTYQVDAGEVMTFSVQMQASLLTVEQPVATEFVQNRPYPNTSGVYSVVGNDNLPIKPAQWTANGGSVRVAIDEVDSSILHVTITGASDTTYAPYRIAMSSGNHYNSLHITGTGVFWDKKLLTLDTGASTAVTGEAVGTVVDVPYVSTLSQAYDMGLRIAQRYAGPTYTLASNLVPAQSPQTLPLGNTAGARVLLDDVSFRVDSATINPETIAFDASLDTTFADFSNKWLGASFADFNTQFAGKTFKDFTLIPLRRD